MPRATLFAVVAVLIGIVAVFSLDTIRENGLSWQEIEATANSPRVEIETNTRVDETRLPEPISEDTELDVTVQSDIDHPVPANYRFFTVEGYDPLRAREFLVDADMPVSVREDYLARLENAVGDKDEMAAILKELRAHLQLG